MSAPLSAEDRRVLAAGLVRVADTLEAYFHDFRDMHLTAVTLRRKVSTARLRQTAANRSGGYEHAARSALVEAATAIHANCSPALLNPHLLDDIRQVPVQLGNAVMATRLLPKHDVGHQLADAVRSSLDRMVPGAGQAYLSALTGANALFPEHDKEFVRQMWDMHFLGMRPEGLMFLRAESLAVREAAAVIDADTVPVEQRRQAARRDRPLTGEPHIARWLRRPLAREIARHMSAR